MPQSQRPTIPYTNKVIEIVDDTPRNDRIINLSDQVKELQNLSTVPVGTWFRRWAFIWLRVYVHESKRGKHERVNIKIPLPIPIIGAAFSRQLSFQKAAKLAAQARRGEDISDSLDSVMGFEFVRVEDNHPDRDKNTLVVVGFD